VGHPERDSDRADCVARHSRNTAVAFEIPEQKDRSVATLSAEGSSPGCLAIDSEGFIPATLKPGFSTEPERTQRLRFAADGSELSRVEEVAETRPELHARGAVVM
jgi:hypothetical protein